MPVSRGRFPKSKPNKKKAYYKGARRTSNAIRRSEERAMAARRAEARRNELMSDAKMSTEQLLERAHSRLRNKGRDSGSVLSKLGRMFNRGG